LAADFLTGFFRGLVPCSNGNLAAGTLAFKNACVDCESLSNFPCATAW
jgi:hypothetical protein